MRLAYAVPDMVAIPPDLVKVMSGVSSPQRSDEPHGIAEDTWIVRGTVAPHRDGTEESRAGWTTMGLVLRADAPNLVLFSGGLESPLAAGTVFRLDPRAEHGVGYRTGYTRAPVFWRAGDRDRSGEAIEHRCFVFLAWDYPPGAEEPLTSFARKALEAVERRWLPPASWSYL